MAKKARKKSAAKRGKKSKAKKTKVRSAKKSKPAPKKKAAKRKAKRATIGERLSRGYHTVVDTVKGTDRLRNKLEPPGTSETE